MKYMKIALCLFAAVFCATFAANAQQEGKQPFMWLDTGVKGGVGGYYLSASTKGDDSFPNIALPYEKGAGGYGGGFGLFLDVHVLKKYLSLEMDVFFDWARIWSTVTYNDVVELDYITKYSSVRIPILVKGSLGNELMRVSLGIGPEFFNASRASTEIEVVSGAEYVEKDDLNNLRSAFSAKSRSDTFLCTNLGFEWMVKKVAITFDFRFAFNPSLPKDYEDRVSFPKKFDTHKTSMQNTASHSADLHVLLGLAYRFEFLLDSRKEL